MALGSFTVSEIIRQLGNSVIVNLFQEIIKNLIPKYLPKTPKVANKKSVSINNTNLIRQPINFEKRKIFKELLEKASKYTFGNPYGDCYLMTMCLTKYMLEEKGITLKSHIGGIKRGKEVVTHLWNSYKTKKIDLTSHRQPKLRVNGMILGEPIKVLENAKIVSIKKMDTKFVRDAAKNWIQIVRTMDKNDVSVSHILLDNLKTGVVPYETLKNALDHKIIKDPLLYQDFFDYME